VSEKYTSDRVIFASAGEQRGFLLAAKERIGNSWQDLAVLVDRHPRTIREWANEKYRIPYPVMIILAKKARMRLPASLIIKTWHDHLSEAGRVGGHAVARQRGGRVAPDEAYRLKKWRKWWDKIGKEKFHPIINKPRVIVRPRRSAKLAEFVGIILGDGGISSMQVIVTLHRNDDREYNIYVQKLMTDLFGVVPAVHQRSDSLADNIVVSRVALVRFCTEDLGLKKGNKVKQRVDIPVWVKENRQYLRACVRGLIDTDGSVFRHRYTVNGKLYSYKKLAFTNASPPLVQSVFRALQEFRLQPRLTAREVRLDSQEDMRKYFIIFGSSNPKHLKRYQQ